MDTTSPATPAAARRALVLSTIAFTVCFAIWTIFAIIGLRIKEEIGLSETEFGLLVGTPILTGSLVRLLLGIWTDQYGGRLLLTIVMLAAAAATFLLSYADTYALILLAALGVGVAGGSFAVGIAYVSRWYPAGKQGTALGIFGMGNVGAAVTKILAPFVMISVGWTGVARIWAVALAVMAVIFFLFTQDDPVLVRRRREGRPPVPTSKHFAPLRDLRVWRFSLYYFFVFGGYVALASWLPRYYTGAYGMSIAAAGILGTAYSIPASIFRPVGGWLSDKYGARVVMYVTFIASVACTFVLSYPETSYVVEGIRGPIAFSFGIGVVAFTVIVFILGFFMSLGKAAVYKHIPVYYPDTVGAVGGIVGMMGGLGGFFLPIAFGALNDLTGVWTSCFMLLFGIVAVSLIWMHAAIRKAEKARIPELREQRYLPELDAGLSETPAAAAPRSGPAGTVVLAAVRPPRS